MTDTTELFDGTGEPTEAARPTTRQAKAARDAALDQVDEHADNAWKIAAAHVIRTLAKDRAEFTADDIREAMPEGVTTHDTRALGPVILASQRAGIITRTDRTAPSRYRHASQMRVWRSTWFPESKEPTADLAARQRSTIEELEVENTALRTEVERLTVELARVSEKARRWKRKAKGG